MLCVLLWQVLEGLGIHEPILDIVKLLHAHVSAADGTSQGTSDISKWGEARVAIEPHAVWTVC